MCRIIAAFNFKFSLFSNRKRATLSLPRMFVKVNSDSESRMVGTCLLLLQAKRKVEIGVSTGNTKFDGQILLSFYCLQEHLYLYLVPQLVEGDLLTTLVQCIQYNERACKCHAIWPIINRKFKLAIFSIIKLDCKPKRNDSGALISELFLISNRCFWIALCTVCLFFSQNISTGLLSSTDLFTRCAKNL